MCFQYPQSRDPHPQYYYLFYTLLYINNISYPLFVHVIRKDIYGGVPYHMRPEAECDTAPHHRYLPYYVEQTGDNEFII